MALIITIHTIHVQTSQSLCGKWQLYPLNASSKIKKSPRKLEWDSSIRLRCKGLINMNSKNAVDILWFVSYELSNRLENLEMVQQASGAWHLFTVVSIMHVMTITGTWNNVSKPITANLKFRDHVVLHEVQWTLNELCAIGCVELINVECRSCCSSYTVGAV